MKVDFRARIALLVLAAALSMPAAEAAAEDTVIYHNGSAMLMQSNGREMRILYWDPRPDLASIGITRGTLLFEGRRAARGQPYVGTAFVFKRDCAPAPYTVSGMPQGDAGFELSGPAPRRSGCRVIGLDWSSPHAHLFFTVPETGE